MSAETHLTTFLKLLRLLKCSALRVQFEKNHSSISRRGFVVDELAFADLQYLSYAEWISGDYNEFVKKSVLPLFKKTYPLKLRETRVLNCVAAAKHDITAKDVADNLRQDPATITRSMVILIGKGYITSDIDVSDGRSRILLPTERGEAAARHFIQLFADIIDKAAHTSNATKFDYDHSALTRSLELVAIRAKAFKDSQRLLARMLRSHAQLSLN